MSALPEDIIDIEDCWNEIGVWRKDGEICPRLEKVIHCRNCDKYASAGRVLLGRQSPDNYGIDWAGLQSNKQQNTAALVSVVIFRLGDEWFSMPVSVFSEVNPMKMIHNLPHNKSKILRGVVNIRGELKICVSIGYLIGLNKGKRNENSNNNTTNRLIMISKDNYEIVFPVTEIAGIHRYDSSELNKCPSTIPGGSDHYFSGSVEWRNNDVACIDEESLFKAISKAIG
jgi:chemotaxis-related protein WspD